MSTIQIGWLWLVIIVLAVLLVWHLTRVAVGMKKYDNDFNYGYGEEDTPISNKLDALFLALCFALDFLRMRCRSLLWRLAAMNPFR